MKIKIAIFFLFFCSPLLADNLDGLLATEKNNIEVYQKASPAVVSIHRFRRVMNHNYQLFNIPAGAGSGIIWDRLGHIVTNFHVVRGAQALTVSRGDFTANAKIIGQEPRKDIAVLKIDAPFALKQLKTLKTLDIANSSKLMVGQKAIAIGNPFGLDHSLTTGVISALGRKVPGIMGRIYDMIQTDASINPGNSGGPLLDSRARLIGMNTAIYSKSGNSSGIGFAVPADDIKRIVTQIIKHGRVILAGIGIQRIEPALARQLGVTKGILIGQVLNNTPAKSAGLRGTYRDNYGRIHLGDVIVGINGHPIANYDDLYNLMVELPVGQTISLKVKRQGRPLTFKLRTIDIASER